jgi:hypothetical protein
VELDVTIPELEAWVRHHRWLYYNAQPIVSDNVFDTVYDDLKYLAPASPVLSEVGAPAGPCPPAPTFAWACRCQDGKREPKLGEVVQKLQHHVVYQCPSCRQRFAVNNR